jgi:hypothetical protein
VARFGLRRWWRRWRPGPWRVALVVAEADQIPESLGFEEAVLVKSAYGAKWLAFDCPCGRGHRVMLNLDRSRRPRWDVSAEVPLSLWPSVDMDANGRRCHYVIHHGHVTWVPGDGDWRRVDYDGSWRKG